MSPGLVDNAILAMRPEDRLGMCWIPGGTFRMGIGPTLIPRKPRFTA